jgi:hypothetical protein
MKIKMKGFLKASNMANLTLASIFCLPSSNPPKLDSKQKFYIWHAPWGYSGLHTGIEFLSPPGPEVGAGRGFCACTLNFWKI